jgi:hypothetical protein
MYLKLDDNKKVNYFLVDTFYKDFYIYIDEKKQNINLEDFYKNYYKYTYVDGALVLTHRDLQYNEYILDHYEDKVIFKKPECVLINSKTIKIKSSVDQNNEPINKYILYRDNEYVFLDDINQYLELNTYVL